MKKFAALCVCLGVLIICFGNVVGFASNDNYRPGETNPCGNSDQWTLFHDDELGVFILDSSLQKLKAQSYWMTSDEKLHFRDDTETDSFVFHKDNDGDINHRIECDRGCLEPGADSIVRSYYTENGKCTVEILDTSMRIQHSIELRDNGTKASRNYTDVSVADIYRVADENDEYHDEILVARSHNHDGSYCIDVTLFDHELNVMDQVTDLIFEPNDGKDNCAPKGISVERGDFNGDNRLEFIVTLFYYDNSDSLTKFVFCAFSYDGDNQRLERSSLSYGSDTQYPFYSLATAAGDFNGDGKDDLALFDRNLIVYTADENLNLRQAKYFKYFKNNTIDNYRLASGLFVWDQETEFNRSRRQLVLVCNEDYYPISVDLFSLNSDFSLNIRKSMTLDNNNDGGRYGAFDVASGNFLVEDNSPTPVEEIAISCIQAIGAGYQSYEFRPQGYILRLASNNQLETIALHLEKNLVPKYANTYQSLCYYSTTLCTMDRDGDSLRLGKPVHVEMDNFLTLDVVMQEPPKHVDFLPVDPDDWEGEWEIINVNAYPEFCVVFEDEEESSVETENTSSTSKTIGGSLAVSAETSFETDWWIFDGAVTLSFEAETGYDYTSKAKSWNKSYKSIKRTISLQANDDDILYGKHQLIDIWRYPILNQVDENGRNVYIDYILPGPYEKFAGAGLRYEQYQPEIINHNLLSYPADDRTFPGDLGEYELPDGTKKNEVMTDNTRLDYTGNEANISLQWSEESEEGASKSTTHAINWNTDFKVAYKGEAKAGFVEDTETKSSVNLNAHGEHAWNQSKVSVTTASSSKGITIECPELPMPHGQWAFSYKPAVYMMADAGGVKAAHAVDFDSLGSSWKRYYGDRPDLSLALPERFHGSRDKTDYVTWIVNEENDRMVMRGFYLYDPEPNPESGESVMISESNIHDGDAINLTANVYNLCLSKQSGPFKVRMEAIKINTETDSEVGERMLIGETKVESINPREMHEVSVRWDTTGYALDISSNIAYRFYVTLDPYNDVNNEIHEWKDEEHPGVEGWTDESGRLYHGNNEGYYPPTGGFFVHESNGGGNDTQSVPKARFRALSLSPFSEINGATAELHDRSLAIQTDDGLMSEGEIRIPLGKKYKVRVHIQLDQEYDATHSMVYFYDRHPDETDEVFDVERVTGFFADTYVWGFWTPKEIGTQEIWAVLGDNSGKDSDRKLHDSLEIVVYDPNSTAVKQWNKIQ